MARETVEFAGEHFAMADRIGLMPLMRFAKMAKNGADSDTLEGLAAMLELLEQCIADDEWERFQSHATKTRAEGDELMAVVGKVFEALSARPTSRPSDSSDGPQPTANTSLSPLAERVIAREVASGRRDRAAWALQAVEAQASQTA